MTIEAGLGSASGYQSITDTPLARKGYHGQIISRGWEDDILSEIVNTRIVERAFDCTQVVEFLLEPDVGPWRQYEDNQMIKADTVNLSSFQMTLCYQAYKAIKIDNAFKRNLCEFWDKFEASFLDQCYRELSGVWQEFVLSAMVLEAHPQNKGRTAGRFRDQNLGSPGSPVRVTPQNLPVEIQRLKAVLMSRQRWYEGNMFLIVPPEIEAVLLQSEYRLAADISCCKDPSILLTGELPGTLVGFRPLLTNRTPFVYDQAVRSNVFYVIGFWKEAFAFWGDITEGRIIEDKDYFGHQYQMAALWGGKAIYNDAIAVGYWQLVA